jgi:hypothetical protein
MGTRNLTAVFHEGKYKVAQYGQWDGYPEGQGLTAHKFLTEQMVRHKFIEQLNKCRLVSDDEYNALWKTLGIDLEARGGFVSMEQSAAFDKAYPYFSRDNGAEILYMIQRAKESGIVLLDRIGFAAYSLFCEWAYVIDLDKNTFEVYQGFNKNPVPKGERFSDVLPGDRTANGEQYHPVRLVAQWGLDSLPSTIDFLGGCYYGGFVNDGDASPEAKADFDDHIADLRKKYGDK